jgi:hypothetical protein
MTRRVQIPTRTVATLREIFRGFLTVYFQSEECIILCFDLFFVGCLDDTNHRPSNVVYSLTILNYMTITLIQFCIQINFKYFIEFYLL